MKRQLIRPLAWVTGCCALLMVSQAAFAQIASAPLDPTKATYSAAASGWKKSTAVFSSFADGGGEGFTSVNKEYDLASARSSAGLSWPMETMALEFSSADLSIKNMAPAVFTAGMITDIKRSTSRFNLAIGDREQVSIGLGVSDITEYNKPNTAAPFREVKTSNLQGSFAMKFAESYYVGALFESKTSELSTQNGMMQPAKSRGTGFGAAAIYGQGTPNVFRVEVGTVEGASTSAGATIGVDYQYVPSTVMDYVEVEWMMRGLLFSYSSTNEDKKPGGNEPFQGSKTKTDTSGVLWAPVGGVSLGFYLNSITIMDGPRNLELQDFMIKAGYIF